MNQHETEMVRLAQEDAQKRCVPKCLIPRCQRPSAPALKRGLCMVCYSSAKKMVEAGTASWEGLAALGLVLLSADQDLFTEAFNEAKGK